MTTIRRLSIGLSTVWSLISLLWLLRIVTTLARGRSFSTTCYLDDDEGSASGHKLTLRRIVALLWLTVIIFVRHG